MYKVNVKERLQAGTRGGLASTLVSDIVCTNNNNNHPSTYFVQEAKTWLYAHLLGRLL